MLDLLIAVATSTVIGLLATRYDEYRFWRSWAPSAFSIGMVVLTVAYAVAGAIGFLGIGALGVDDPGVATAALEGGAGHAILRAQIDRLGPSSGEEGRSVLTLTHRWILDLLDVRARAGIERWVQSLDDEALTGVTFDLFWRHLDTPSEQVTAQIHELLSAAAHDLLGESGPTQADGRGRIRGFCCREIEQRRVVIGDAQ